MINVRISQKNLLELENAGYIVDDSKDIVTMSDKYSRPMAEIVFHRETKNLVIMTEDRMICCLEVTSIEKYYNGIVICYVNHEHENRILSVRG